ncbi:hypothetical protein LguiB_016165 [Lonicera macranthoides]
MEKEMLLQILSDQITMNIGREPPREVVTNRSYVSFTREENDADEVESTSCGKGKSKVVDKPQLRVYDDRQCYVAPAPTTRPSVFE